jgi:hypothetical protein
MADKDDDDLIVNIDDLDTVQVNVDDNPALAEAKAKDGEGKKKEPRTRRVSPEPDHQVVVSEHEDALAKALDAGKKQEDARRAAEATAANERQLREQAQTQAAQARQEADQYRESASNSELAIIENGITSANSQIESLQEEYTRAAEAGEFAKMGQIQTKIAKASATLDRLENTKATFDVRKTQTTEGRVESPTVQQPALEQYLSQFAPAAQTWLRQHPDCVPAQFGGDAVKNSKMMAGHYGALAQNIVPNTNEYFEYLDSHLGTAAQTTQVNTVESKAATIQVADTTSRPVKQVQPSAPPSRDTPAANGQQQRSVREVRLTKDQQEMAKVSFPHLPESQAFGQYARNLIELEAEGKIGRSTH